MSDHKFYKPNTRHTGILSIFFFSVGVLLFVASIIAGYFLSHQRLERDSFTPHDLYTMEAPGTLDVLIQFDKEPVDFVLVSPSGERFPSDSFEDLEETNDTLSVSLETQDTGNWKIEYNQKSNNTVTVTANAGQAEAQTDEGESANG